MYQALISLKSNIKLVRGFPDCLKMFSTICARKNHYRRIHRKKQWTSCSNCNLNFSTKKQKQNYKEESTCTLHLHRKHKEPYCSNCNRTFPNKNEKLKHKEEMTCTLMRDILNKLVEHVTTPEYKESKNLNGKYEKKEEWFTNESALKTKTIQKSCNELERFQDDVVDAVITFIDVYYNAQTQNNQGTFFQIAGELINRLTKEIKDSYMTLHGGLQNICLTPDNRLFIRNQVERYFQLESWDRI